MAPKKAADPKRETKPTGPKEVQGDPADETEQPSQFPPVEAPEELPPPSRQTKAQKERKPYFSV